MKRALLLLAAAATLLGVSSCGSNKNHDTREAVARALAEDDDRRDCVDPYLCTPDPGSRPISAEECESATAGLDFLSIFTFDAHPKSIPQRDADGNQLAPREVHYAETLYSYDDKTTFTRKPVQGWEPETFPANLCGREDNYALRSWGGPFLGWGGGLGSRVDRLWELRCNVADNQERPDFCPPPDTEFHTTWDVNNGRRRAGYWLDMSEWEGISFWGRRGPDGQPGIRVSLADTNVDSDISFLQHYEDPEAPRACERNKECGCRTHRPCTRFEGNSRLPLSALSSTIIYDSIDVGPDGQVTSSVRESALPIEDRAFYYCYDPEVDPEPNAVYEDAKYLMVQDEDGNDLIRYDACGPSICNMLMEGFQAPDMKFHDKPCTEYTFRTGLHGAYCFDPETDPPPISSSDECGDYWMKSIELSTDWKFYKIPFTQLLQQGWAKEFHDLRIDQVSTVRFIWGRGYTDFWLDDVSFYRTQRD